MMIPALAAWRMRLRASGRILEFVVNTGRRRGRWSSNTRGRQTGQTHKLSGFQMTCHGPMISFTPIGQAGCGLFRAQGVRKSSEEISSTRQTFSGALGGRRPAQGRCMTLSQAELQHRTDGDTKSNPNPQPRQTQSVTATGCGCISATNSRAREPLDAAAGWRPGCFKIRERMMESH